MNNLFVLIGVPGCGKSTYAKKMLDRGEVQYHISSDSIREEVTGDAGDITQDKKVWEILYARVAYSLRYGNVVLDTTGLTPNARKEALNAAEQGVAKPWAVVLDVPHDVCRARNLKRDRVVPESVMDRMCARFNSSCSTKILQNEGFSVFRPATIS